MKRRLFVAINLPESVKNKLQEYQHRWDNLPARFTKKNSLHLTLVFIGYVSDEEMVEILRIIYRVGQKHEPFNIELEIITLGPPGKPPRMIWAEGKPSKELADLENDLEKSLINSGKIGFAEKDSRPFKPHITLARIRTFEWRKIPEKPKIEEKISITVPVESIELMESELKIGGAEYTILESAKLGGI